MYEDKINDSNASDIELSTHADADAGPVPSKDMQTPPCAPLPLPFRNGSIYMKHVHYDVHVHRNLFSDYLDFYFLSYDRFSSPFLSIFTDQK